MGENTFADDALGANRSGQLGAEQRRELEQGLAHKHSGLTGLVTRALDPLAKDVNAGEVQSIEGAITKNREAYEYGGNEGGTRYRIHIGNREAGDQKFRAGRELWEYAPEAGTVRLFYTPRARWAINLELLADEQLGELTPDGVMELASNAAEARRAGDRVGEAEAASTLDAMRRLAVGEPQQGAPTDAPSQPAGGPISKAILGSWESPIFRVDLTEGGGLEAHLPDGSKLPGRWSLDEAGRLHADLPGAPIVAEVAVAADSLTLVVDGQTIAFRRAAPG